ncbi:regulatory protein, GntR [Marinomonas sp. MED121]|uniref:aminotransferase-like domain-containing protein n=1 Tax=Marinomonas sp. MED121 TaxID=314277 RepID=UPI0000690D40|nr:PLP-dependent aminotransferase family protein [Marinomonas sp. MED121]EAQ65225.1 regulatory protein, GntR [Marinomonas sp. MED121]
MDQPLYEKIADQVESQIQEGVFLPGTKIPSVRKSSKQMSVSVATVLQAYSLLEDRGVVKARPQKGYFVQDNLPQPQALPQFEPSHAQESVPELIRSLLHASQRPDIIQFGAAIPHTQFLPIRQLQKSVGRLMRLEPEICAAYEFTPGSLNLRRQIAIRMLDAGCNIQPDDITITLGCQNAMILALRTITEPGDTIIIETPTYHGLLQAIDELKLKAIEIPCDPSSGIDLDAMSQVLAQWRVTACVITPSNQNPTGATLKQEAKTKLLNLCQQYSTTIIEDDVYGELSYCETREKAIKAEDPQADVIYCSSFSKSIAPGFRIGWIIGGKYQQRIEQHAYVESLAIPTLTQKAIANFLENGAYDRHLRKTRHTYEENLRRCQQAITQFFPSGTYTSDPQGGFLLWITLPPEVNALTLHKAALEHGIGTIPGLAFSLTHSFSHHLRINYAISWDSRIEGALKLVGNMAKKLTL